MATTANGSVRKCKDCPPGSTRPAPKPGPRCVTHDRAVSRTRKDAAWERNLIATFGITAAEYWAIYEAQGGVCAICRRAKGLSRKLAVEHYHGQKTSRYERRERPGPEVLRPTIRGLVCMPCNLLIQSLGDDPAEFRRIAEYLETKPAQAVLASLYDVHVS